MAEFEQLAAHPQEPLSQKPYDHWPLPGSSEAALMFYRTPTGFLLRFPGVADFTLAVQDRQVLCTPVPDASQQTISAVYFNQVVPLIRNHDGELVLHASAIAGKAGALAFLGPSGRGKSTLAAAFARAGFPFLTDDGVVLEAVGAAYAVKPNQPFMRLRSDSEAAIFNRSGTDANDMCDGKNHVISGPDLPFQECSVPLRAIYLLGPGESDGVAIERLKPAAALSELIKHSFILDVDDRARLRTHFDRISSLAEIAACFAFDYPRRYEELPQVMNAILDHACKGEFSS